MPAPAPQPGPAPKQAPRPAPLEPPNGGAVAAAGAVRTIEAAIDRDDDALDDSADSRDLPDVDNLPPSNRPSRGPRQPIVALAGAVLVLVVGGYLAWRYFHSGEPVASAVPQGQSEESAAVEPTAAAADPAETEAVGSRPAAPVEPDWPMPMPEPSDAGKPQDPFANFPSQPNEEPAISMPVEPATPEPAPPLDSGRMLAIVGPEPTEPTATEPTTPERTTPEPTTPEPTTPEPTTPEPVEPAEDRINALFAAADADGFKWTPRTPEQYDQLAELAEQLTLAKHALAVSGSPPGSPPAVLQGVARLADQAFAAIQKAKWGPEQLNAFNSFAVDQVDQVGHGVVMYGVVWATDAQKPDIVVMALHGTQKPVLVQLASPVPDLAPGSRWLIFGFVTPSTIPVNVKGESEPRRAQLVLVHYMTRVQ